ncbi:MAG: tRNA (adenosine(37)-N6)-threonylcarbamoyltransferase complex ATPase subunit type 1 TsaE [Pikeienuella sp.]|uniref:tRNA (adenosine(37)-N6)-threonylcarbamoyltransferase complex ATPase subunit type 1 TsaE n=1 Tax=Pikeienuella sp. TaxID=2831957 RepID=UPI00391BEB94
MERITGHAGGARGLADEAETARAGAALGRALRAGDVVFLSGGLGAGKTALARAAIAARLAAAGRPAEEIPSPTFTLVQVYEADAPLWHADLYRLSGPEDARELGLDAAAEEGAILLVEWPERLGALAPARRLEIALESPEAGGRLLLWRGVGGGWDHVAEALA